MANRVIVYGDIHGCLEEFKQLRKELKVDKDDIEISVGDFLNKGPLSLQTLRFIKKHKILSVMGNNEAKVIRLYHKYKAQGESFLETLRSSDKETLLEIAESDIAFLETLPYYLKIDTLTIVHGGIQDGTSLHEDMSDKEKKSLTQLRFYNKAHEPIPYADFENRETFWSETYDGREGFVVFGHHPFEEVKIEKHAIGIDTGCVYGRSLTAISFPYIKKQIDLAHYTLHSVKSRQTFNA